ncbi:N,N-dimethylformamidase beta subunit family domain-containing protein [Streptacidiphilus monticola]|uniref:N,N-dimethylformamidase beta subunit family domain-containing protein n=1 Tax=Streptacidiphilus monticola TaxID=2161674 RepID=A0ABW1G048_9ACTN
MTSTRKRVRRAAGRTLRSLGIEPPWTVGRENARPGTDGWRVRRPGPDRAVEGYADRLAVDPGESFRLFVSTTAASFRIEAYRMGWYGGKQGRLVWRSEEVPGRLQPEAKVEDPYWTVVAPWEPSTTVPTRGWPEGCYLLKLVSAEGFERWVPITVRSRSTAGKLVMVNATSTWQAYNRWGGGWNIYGGPGGSVDDYERRSRKVSLDRPYDKNGSYFNWYELPLLSLAEQLGLPLGYATDHDLHARPELFRRCRGLVFGGHDEYWTSGMRETVLRVRDSGGNLAFFGANTAYRHVRFEPSTLGLGEDRVMTCFKRAEEDPFLESNPDEATQQWRLPPNPRPESEICGVQYESNPCDAPFVVTEPDAWLFAGTGAVKGSSYGRLIRVEYDKLFTDVPVPRPIQVLSDSPLVCRGTSTYANSCYYTSPSGAGVFSTGTLGWTPALPLGGYRKQNPPETCRFTEQVTKNVLQEFARGPVGRRHPAVDNYQEYARPFPEDMPYSWEF